MHGGDMGELSCLLDSPRGILSAAGWERGNDDWQKKDPREARVARTVRCGTVWEKRNQA